MEEQKKAHNLHLVPIVPSKIQIPPLRSKLVKRAELLQKLQPSTYRKLTLIAAPAGFGKTTLVLNWIHTREVCVAWLSLDVEDNDPVRFWVCVVVALQQVIPEFGTQTLELIHVSEPHQMRSVVASLVNELATTDRAIVLVLDDYHLIENATIHDMVAFLIDHMPLHCHLTITTRNEPPLPLARFRARGQMLELRAKDLRFSQEETSRFFTDVMNLSLGEAALVALEERTEGWVAGLQLAALSLQNRADIAAFVTSFTGDDRYIVDYLAEEVLKQQSEAIRDFLLKTSVLERMNGNLCDAITGREDGQTTLEELERRNLFVIPLDNRRQWYRYHHLFADFLRQQLQRENASGIVKKYHRRASQWYEAHDLAAQAIHHALAAEDVTRITSLIEKYAYATRMRGEVSTVLAWLCALPEAFVLQQPRLCLEFAWCLILAGQPAKALPYVQAIETRLDFKVETANRSIQNHNKQTRPLIGEAIAVRAKVACDTRHPIAAIGLFQQARTYLPSDNYALQTIISLHLGTAYLSDGKIEAAQQAYSDAVELSQASGDFNATITALSRLGDSHLLQGHLNQADLQFRRALQLATWDGKQPSPVATRAYAGIAQILAERKQLEEAIGHYGTTIHLAEQGGDQQGLAMGLLALAQTYAQSGDGHQAQVVVERVQQMTLGSTLPCLNGILTIVQAQIAFMLNDFERTKFWLERYQSGCYMGLDRSHLILKAHLLLKQGLTEEAATLLEQLTTKTDSISIMGNNLEITVLHSLILEQRGELTESEHVLLPSIQLGQAEGYIRTFIDVIEILPILRRLLAKGIASEYISELLELMEGSILNNPLTEREMEVLNLIAAGCANKEIAQELVIAVSTVKRHIHHIYEKLDARSRTQALAHAREMNLF
ncbi:MAG: LuxR C-terminal-related transcriptional regulator [Chloroflexi bacterium]|nr:LuxR C-terminal-related transcriptional regulator [Chloroflexota bacterium]